MALIIPKHHTKSHRTNQLIIVACIYQSHVFDVSPCLDAELVAAELEQCALNAYCSNSFVFGKNYPNFD
jgi:hypothetical protein